MDRKSFIILVISFLFLMAWFPLTNKIFPPKPIPKTNLLSHATNTFPAGTNRIGRTGEVISGESPIAPGTPGILATNQPAGPEETVTLENADARYVFTSIGGGVKLVELKSYLKTVGCVSGRKVNAKELASLNTKAPLPAFAVIAPETGMPEAGFKLTKNGDTVRAERQLASGVTQVNEYQLSTNYLLKATLRYENRTGQAIQLPERELVIGTATPMSHHDESQTLGLQWFNGSKLDAVSEAWFANKTMGCLPGTPRTFFGPRGSSNVVWASVNNRFFTMIAVPEPGPAWQVVGRRIDLPPPTPQEAAEDPAVLRKPFGYQAGILLPAISIPPQNALSLDYNLFAGPKEYKTLSRLPKEMDQAMFSGWYSFFAKILLLSMNGLNALGITYGWAIIVITVLIKVTFWPLTNASTKSMKRLSKLQPQMKAIQEKYKDDPAKMNAKVMEFMKEHKVNPLGGCLPLLLQLPFLAGFYQMLQSAIELRGQSFVWACDLSEPDTVFSLFGIPINPFALLMAASMLWQSHMTPPSPGMDPAQQKMMRYMPLMFVVFFYNRSSGLTLYWAVQNLLSIIQTKLTKTRPEDDPTYKPPVTPARPVQRKK
jgi:YidC/Oxa1 family membrane protein insertase